jgi:hypothetical protein
MQPMLAHANRIHSPCHHSRQQTEICCRAEKEGPIRTGAHISRKDVSSCASYTGRRCSRTSAGVVATNVPEPWIAVQFPLASSVSSGIVNSVRRLAMPSRSAENLLRRRFWGEHMMLCPTTFPEARRRGPSRARCGSLGGTRERWPWRLASGSLLRKSRKSSLGQGDMGMLGHCETACGPCSKTSSR